jgi:prepilin-type N-terminal cleavage/methylation domain-containing protein
MSNDKFPMTNQIQMTKSKTKKSGFTLVELMVSVSVFVVIMVISMGSILSIFDANRKSQSLRTVMDNLNFTLEAMTRTIRFGTNYHCDVTIISPPINSPRDCVNGASSIVVKAFDGSQVIYKLKTDGNGVVRIVRSNSNISSGADYYVTSSDVTITSLAFRVIGSLPYSSGDLIQPQVIITVNGNAGVKATVKSSFSLQTTVSQRMFDSQ